uniref:Uncharacterized protein n=1 Tax=Cannabis sativa TaxID=3483 RepID=A0A803PIQ2_CANSA
MELKSLANRDKGKRPVVEEDDSDFAPPLHCEAFVRKSEDRNWCVQFKKIRYSHRSDETLKAAFSSVSSGTFCQSGKVFGDNTWRYQK